MQRNYVPVKFPAPAHNRIALPNYGYSTAVGLFKSLVGGALVLICNELSKKTRGRGIAGQCGKHQTKQRSQNRCYDGIHKRLIQLLCPDDRSVTVKCNGVQAWCECV